MESEKKLKGLKLPAIIAGLAGIFLFVWYPLSIKLSRCIVAVPYEDNIIQFWIWREWFTEKVITLFMQADPFSMKDFLWYGILGNSAVQETGNVLDIMLLSIPLRKIFAFPLSYNIKFLIILAFNCWSAFFVTERMTKNRVAAFFSAAFMIINPMIILALLKGRMRLTILGFMILAVYYLIEVSRKPDWKNALKLGIFWGLSAIFYWFYGLFTAFFVLFFFIGKALLQVKRKETKELLKFAGFLLMSAGICLIIALPWIIPYAVILKSAPGYSDTAFFKNFPALEKVLSPSPQGGAGYSWRVFGYIIDESLPLGYYLPFVFTLIGLFALRKPKPLVIFFILMIIFFTVFSYGPYLKKPVESTGGANPRPEFYGGYPDRAISMPYKILFKYVPFLSRMQHPDHALAGASVALLFLGAFGFSSLYELLEKKPKIMYGAGILIIILICIEPNFYHQRTKLVISEVHFPKVYSKLKSEPPGGVIEVPLLSPIRGTWYLPDHYDTYQSITGRDYYNSRFVNILRASPAFRDRLEKMGLKNRLLPRNGFISYLEKSLVGEEADFDKTALEELKKEGWKYAVLHEVDFIKAGKGLANEDDRPPFDPDTEGGETGKARFEKIRDKLKNSSDFEVLEKGKEYDYFFQKPNEKNPCQYEIILYKIL